MSVPPAAPPRAPPRSRASVGQMTESNSCNHLPPPPRAMINRTATPPPPAVVGPPPVPQVVGPPPVPVGYKSTSTNNLQSSNSVPARTWPATPTFVPPSPSAPTATPQATPIPTVSSQPRARPFKATKVAAIKSSPWFPLIELMLRENQVITRSVMNMLKRSDTDLLAHALVNIFSTTGRIFDFIVPVIEDEVETTEKAGTLFRGNCLASKILSSYSVSVGKDYLRQLLVDPINSVIHEGDFEINPLKLRDGGDIEQNYANVRKGVQTFMDAILDSVYFCPLVIRKICAELRIAVQERFPQSLYSVVGGFFFLRFVCPAIVSPEGFGVMESVPGKGRRPLVLISKILQNLGNGVQFGNKEEYMTPLNDLIDYYLPQIQSFFDELTQLPDEEIDTPPIPVDNDLLEKFHTVTVYSKDRILETISAYETAYDLPVGSETKLFQTVLVFLESSKQDDKHPAKKGRHKKKT